MYKYIILVFTMFFLLNSYSQNDIMQELFKEYEGKKGFKTITVTQKMFEVILKYNLTDKHLINLLNSTREIKLISADKTFIKTDFYEVLRDYIRPGSNYQVLPFNKSLNENLDFFVQRKNEKIIELIMVTGDPFKETIYSIKGDINISEIYRISELIDLNELKNLEKIK